MEFFLFLIWLNHAGEPTVTKKVYRALSARHKVRLLPYVMPLTLRAFNPFYTSTFTRGYFLAGQAGAEVERVPSYQYG